jgi:hypothetical protein
MWRPARFAQIGAISAFATPPAKPTSFIVEFAQQFSTLRQLCSTGHTGETSLRENGIIAG